MYVASYNDVPHTEVGNNTLSLECNSTGYKYKVNGELQNIGLNTNIDTLDYKGYNSMYAGRNGSTGEYYWWLASPSSSGDNAGCFVSDRTANLSCGSCGFMSGVGPLVSLKSGIQVQVEE